MSRDPFIGGSDRQKNPYDEHFAREQRQKEEEKLFSEDPHKRKNNKGLHALVTSSLKKVLDLFSLSSERSISSAEKTFVEDDLEKLKLAFIKLKEEDLSQNIDFLKELSYVWHDFMKNYNFLYRNKKSSIFKHIDILVKKISSYPEGEEKTMGFYLSHFAGEDWLPFPYMNMLQTLYLDDKEILEDWIILIDDVIIEIKKRKHIR